MLGWTLRVLVAIAIVVVLVRLGFRMMRSYVHGGLQQRDERAAGPPPTMEVTGDFRLRCKVCGLEVQVREVPETEAGPYDLGALRHCREEMEPLSPQNVENPGKTTDV